MPRYKDRFGVDVAKRAARVRGRPLPQIVKELLANSLDAGATEISLTCRRADGSRRDGAGLIAFELKCVDNGRGCAEPEVLRRVGSSTSDLHPETRGRFGQGLIDVVAICEQAEIRTLRHRLLFDDAGCTISVIKNPVQGMSVTALLRHAGEGCEELDAYFGSVILPSGVKCLFNDREVEHRCRERVVSDLKLATVVFDPQAGKFRHFQRVTNVEIYPRQGDA